MCAVNSSDCSQDSDDLFNYGPYFGVRIGSIGVDLALVVVTVTVATVLVLGWALIIFIACFDQAFGLDMSFLVALVAPWF